MGLSSSTALLWLTGAGPNASYFPRLFFPYALMGLGMGTAMLPLLTIAMSGVPERDAGLASGIVNVSMQLAGALGIAVLGTLADLATRRRSPPAERSAASALTGGYHLGFEIAAGAVAVGLVLVRDGAAGAGPRAGPARGLRGRRRALTAAAARLRPARRCGRRRRRRRSSPPAPPRRRPARRGRGPCSRQ